MTAPAPPPAPLAAVGPPAGRAGAPAVAPRAAAGGPASTRRAASAAAGGPVSARLVASAAARGPVSARFVASATVLPMFALALVVSFAVTPEDIEAGRVVLSPACHFKATFGRECPTCGLTRAFCALSHGRLDDARRYNRASPPLYALWWAGSCAALATLLHARFARTEIKKVSP